MKIDVRRGFFDRLQQRVEGVIRQLVNFVDDEDLVTVAHGHDRQPGNDHFADILDLCVSRGIDFEHVDIAPFGNLAARIADTTRFGGWTFLAAQRSGQNSRRRRLANAARACEDERLRDAAAPDRVGKRSGDRRLADDVIELLRAPLAGEDLVGHNEGSSGSWVRQFRGSSVRRFASSNHANQRTLRT